MTDSISLFDDTIEWHQASGLSYFYARQRAIDDYRKFGKRQVQGDTFDLIINNYYLVSEPSAEDLIDINLVFEKLIKDVVESYKSKKNRIYCAKLICALYRFYGLDEALFEDNMYVIDELLGDFYPVADNDIAKFLGYKVRENGSCSAITNWKHDLARVAAKYSLYSGHRDVNAELDDEGVRAYA